MMETVLLVAALVGACFLGVAALLALALWVRVWRANKRGLGPSRNAAADTDEIPAQPLNDKEHTP